MTEKFSIMSPCLLFDRHMILRKLAELSGKIISHGISPDKLALTVALGITIGFIPMLWGGTLLCTLIAYCFRLNLIAIQVVNYLAYPLQLALIVPFYRLGARFFPWAPTTRASTILYTLGINAANDMMKLVLSTVKAIGVWLIIAPPTACLLYLCLIPACKRLLSRREQAREASQQFAGA